jgi:hypothetical protein
MPIEASIHISLKGHFWQKTTSKVDNKGFFLAFYLIVKKGTTKLFELAS